jgi:RNA polymerase sigma-70 factor, ECF subfamily
MHARGEREAWNARLERYRVRLRRMLKIRLDARLRSRINASDVIQEA